MGAKTTTQVVGRGKGSDLIFTPGGNAGRFGTFGTYKQNSSPAIVMNFRFERPDKLYFWKPNTSSYDGDYFTIISAAGNKVILKYFKIGIEKVEYYYYTVD